MFRPGSVTRWNERDSLLLDDIAEKLRVRDVVVNMPQFFRDVIESVIKLLTLWWLSQKCRQQ